jgi:hypothetical protein
VGLDGCVRRAVESELALEHDVRAGHGAIDIAEVEQHVLADVVLLVLVDLRLCVGEGVFRREEGVERFVLDDDGVERAGRRVFVHGRDGGNGIADEAHLVHRQRRLVLRPRDDAVARRQIAAGDRRVHARHRQRLRDVDALDARVRVRAPERLGVQHARQLNVVGVDRLTGRFGQTVGLALRLADN